MRLHGREFEHSFLLLSSSSDRFSARSFDKSLMVAYNANCANAKSLIALSEELKIDKSDVQTGDFTVSQEYPATLVQQVRYTARVLAPVGYTVSRSVTFVLKDVDKLATLLAAGLQQGANGLESIQYERSDAATYRATARLAALKAAREKAIALAESVGGKIGKPMNISEGYSSSHPSGFPSLSGATNGTIGPQGVDATYVTDVDGGIELGELTIGADVSATFELE